MRALTDEREERREKEKEKDRHLIGPCMLYNGIEHAIT